MQGEHPIELAAKFPVKAHTIWRLGTTVERLEHTRLFLIERYGSVAAAAEALHFTSKARRMLRTHFGDEL